MNRTRRYAMQTIDTIIKWNKQRFNFNVFTSEVLSKSLEMQQGKDQ